MAAACFSIRPVTSALGAFAHRTGTSSHSRRQITLRTTRHSGSRRGSLPFPDKYPSHRHSAQHQLPLIIQRMHEPCVGTIACQQLPVRAALKDASTGPAR